MNSIIINKLSLSRIFCLYNLIKIDEKFCRKISELNLRKKSFSSIENAIIQINIDKYNLSIGSNVPNLKLKSGNKKCIYQVEDYKIGDFITKDYSYDKECEQFIEEINNYIKEYGNILVESNVNY